MKTAIALFLGAALGFYCRWRGDRHLAGMDREKAYEEGYEACRRDMLRPPAPVGPLGLVRQRD